MSRVGIKVRNWRDADPYISHESAVIWAILAQHSDENTDPYACMQQLSGFARHFLQGRKNSDHHWHDGAEQFYYILSGGGDGLLIEWDLEEGREVCVYDVGCDVLNIGIIGGGERFCSGGDDGRILVRF